MNFELRELSEYVLLSICNTIYIYLGSYLIKSGWLSWLGKVKNFDIGMNLFINS